MTRASDKTISRLSLYRRALARFEAIGRAFVFSHELAEETGVSAAQVRRDLMVIGYYGSPNRGYETGELIHSIGERLDDASGRTVVLVGLGNLGRAVISYVARQRPQLAITAAFDEDADKVGRVVEGCTCYAMADLARVVRELDAKVAIVTVPASAAQEAADRLVAAGVTGILNFAPATLRLPDDVYVERRDIIASLETVSYFAGRARQQT